MTPEQVREALRGDLPPVVLVTGPGAFQFGIELAGRYGQSLEITDLTAENAHCVAATAHMAPPAGCERRAFFIWLDGASTSGPSLDALLKVLEEPPPLARFVLASRWGTLPAIESRAQRFVLGGGPDESEPGPDQAEACGAVGTAIRAARSGQAAVLSQAVKGWGRGHSLALSQWALEASTGRWERYSPDFAPGVTHAQALRVLEVLGRYRGARTAAVVALDRVFATR